jgi:hypothetical protein
MTEHCPISVASVRLLRRILLNGISRGGGTSVGGANVVDIALEIAFY